jgi:hypothetical protein
VPRRTPSIPAAGFFAGEDVFFARVAGFLAGRFESTVPRRVDVARTVDLVARAVGLMAGVPFQRKCLPYGVDDTQHHAGGAMQKIVISPWFDTEADDAEQQAAQS